jgi:proteasome activator subunit 4
MILSVFVTILSWFLLTTNLMQVPISLTVQKCASNFKKTHQDTWHEDSKRFTEDQLAALSTLLTGSSYCAYDSFFLLPQAFIWNHV